MIKHRLSITANLIGTVSLLFCAPAAESRTAKVYVLQQATTRYVGEQTAFISPDSLRLESHRTGSAILWKPPGKNIQIINDSKKVFYETNIDQWRSKSIMQSNSIKARYGKGLHWKLVESGTICGLNAEKYEIDKPDELSDDEDYLSYWLARDIHISKTACAILSQSVGSVEFDKEVLRVELRKNKNKIKNKFKNKDNFKYKEKDKNQNHHKKKKKRIIFDTTSCEVKTMDVSIFVVPKNYKRVTSEVEVLGNLDSSELEGIDSIIYRSQSKTGTKAVEQR